MSSAQLKLLRDQRKLAAQKLALVTSDETMQQKYQAWIEELDRRIAETD